VNFLRFSNNLPDELFTEWTTFLDELFSNYLRDSERDWVIQKFEIWNNIRW